MRRLSSSTASSPSEPRTRSMPATAVYDQAGTSTPIIQGSKYTEVSIARSGTTPAVTIARSPYTSAVKALSARTRCARPRSTSSHSAASITRGTGSTWKGSAVAPEPKLTPSSSTPADTAAASPARSRPAEQGQQLPVMRPRNARAPRTPRRRSHRPRAGSRGPRSSRSTAAARHPFKKASRVEPSAALYLCPRFRLVLWTVGTASVQRHPPEVRGSAALTPDQITRRSLLRRGAGAAVVAAGAGGLDSSALAAGRRLAARLREPPQGGPHRPAARGGPPAEVALGHARAQRARALRGGRADLQPLVRRPRDAPRVHPRARPRGLRQPLPPQLGLQGLQGRGDHPLLRVRHGSRAGRSSTARRPRSRWPRSATPTFTWAGWRSTSWRSPRWGFRCGSTRARCAR